MSTNREQRLRDAEAIARRIVEPLGLEIVEFVYRSQGKHSVLRIDIDRPGPSGVTIEDCERVSRAFDEEAEQAGLLEGGFELQVSSPGLDRQLRSDDDLRRNRGRRLAVETARRVAGAVTFLGVLEAFDETTLTLLLDDGTRAEILRGVVSSAHQDYEDSARKDAGHGPRKRREPRGIV